MSKQAPKPIQAAIDRAAHCALYCSIGSLFGEADEPEARRDAGYVRDRADDQYTPSPGPVLRGLKHDTEDLARRIERSPRWTVSSQYKPASGSSRSASFDEERERVIAGSRNVGDAIAALCSRHPEHVAHAFHLLAEHSGSVCVPALDAMRDAFLEAYPKGRWRREVLAVFKRLKGAWQSPLLPGFERMAA